MAGRLYPTNARNINVHMRKKRTHSLPDQQGAASDAATTQGLWFNELNIYQIDDNCKYDKKGTNPFIAW